PGRSRDVLRPGTADQPERVQDHRRDLRLSRGGDRGPAHAADPLPGQAGGRTGEGEGDRQDPEEVSASVGTPSRRSRAESPYRGSPGRLTCTTASSRPSGSFSSCRNQPSCWFQLTKIRLAG